jgi:hypothetical protein
MECSILLLPATPSEKMSMASKNAGIKNMVYFGRSLFPARGLGQRDTGYWGWKGAIIKFLRLLALMLYVGFNGQ